MQGKNNWKDIWNKREDFFHKIDCNDKKQMFLELKRIDGFDVIDNGITYNGFLRQYVETKKDLHLNEGDSIFEVGCGAGANLYLFHQDKIKIGGLDYSNRLIGILKKVFKSDVLIECLCEEAIDCPTNIKYDVILSNSVFSYFPDHSYAEQVLKKMLEKTRKSIGLVDIFDQDKKVDFIKFRYDNIKDYEERYKNLPKLFYTKKFFIDFAHKNNVDIYFNNYDVEGYWNNCFSFNCFMYVNKSKV